jgi:hypothetical protein
MHRLIKSEDENMRYKMYISGDKRCVRERKLVYKVYNIRRQVFKTTKPEYNGHNPYNIQGKKMADFLDFFK